MRTARSVMRRSVIQAIGSMWLILSGGSTRNHNPPEAIGLGIGTGYLHPRIVLHDPLFFVVLDVPEPEGVEADHGRPGRDQQFPRQQGTHSPPGRGGSWGGLYAQVHALIGLELDFC